jgi:hypothetical protein
MAVVKRRPKLRLRVPAEVRPGETFPLQLITALKKPVDVDFIDVRLIGVESAGLGHGNDHHTVRHELIAARARLTSRTTLNPPERIFRCDVPLPAEAPPSYTGRRGKISYEIWVHASIPWWPDARAVFEIRVAPSLPAGDLGDPVIYSSAPSGPKGKEAFIELSLPQRAAAAGSVVSGAIALGNSAFHRFTGVKIALLGVEEVRQHRQSHTTEVWRHEAQLPASELLGQERRAAEGAPLPFQFRIPAVPPSFTSKLLKLSWWFEITAQVRWGSDVRFLAPIQILPPLLLTAQPSRLAPPTVGSERVQAMWAKVAAEAQLTLDDERLVGDGAGGATIVVRREHRGGAGLFLVGEIAWPDLGVGLRHRTRLARAATIEGREEAQVAAFRALVATGDKHTPWSIVNLTDTGLMIELRDQGTRQRLAAFVRDLRTLAAAASKERAAIPAPAALAGALPAWETLARELSGSLARGPMSIVGSWNGHAVSVTTRRADDGELLSTIIVVTPPSPLSMKDGVAEAETRALVTELARDSARVHISPAAITIELPAPERNSDALFPAVRAAVRLAERLRPMANVYR